MCGSSNGTARFVNGVPCAPSRRVERTTHRTEMLAISRLRSETVYATGAGVSWHRRGHPFRSPRVATRDYFGGGAWTAARTCNTCHIATRLIIHIIVTRPPCADAACLPNTGGSALALLDLLTSSTWRGRDEMSPACHQSPASRPGPFAIVTAFDFKTKTILQPMFTLAFSQAAQRSVSKLSSTCVIAAPIKRTVPRSEPTVLRPNFMFIFTLFGSFI